MSDFYLGDYAVSATIDTFFNTTDADNAPASLTSGALAVYKGNNTAESTAGITLTTNFDARTGLNQVRITLATDTTFYAGGFDYSIVLTAGSIGGVSVSRRVIRTFSIANRNNAMSLTDAAYGELMQAMFISEGVKFVSTGGNNSNSGIRPSLAKASVASAVAAGAAGGTVIVMPGQFTGDNSPVTLPSFFTMRGSGQSLSQLIDTPMISGNSVEISDVDLKAGQFEAGNSLQLGAGHAHLHDMVVVNPAAGGSCAVFATTTGSYALIDRTHIRCESATRAIQVGNAETVIRGTVIEGGYSGVDVTTKMLAFDSYFNHASHTDGNGSVETSGTDAYIQVARSTIDTGTTSADAFVASSGSTIKLSEVSYPLDRTSGTIIVLDLPTIASALGPQAKADVASAVLVTPSQKVATDNAGRVTTSNPARIIQPSPQRVVQPVKE